MFAALKAFWIMVKSFINGMQNLAEGFDEVTKIAKDGAINLRQEMLMEAVAAKKQMIKANGLTESEVKETTDRLTEVKAA